MIGPSAPETADRMKRLWLGVTLAVYGREQLLAKLAPFEQSAELATQAMWPNRWASR